MSQKTSLSQKLSSWFGGQATNTKTTTADGETKLFTDSEIESIRLQQKAANAAAMAEAEKRGYKLHPKLAAKSL